MCEIGTKIAKRGDVKQVKVLGTLALIDEGTCMCMDMQQRGKKLLCILFTLFVIEFKLAPYMYMFVVTASLCERLTANIKIIP